MKKLTIAIATLLLFVSAVSAQEAPKKRKPGFAYNEQTINELGLSPEQKQKMTEAQNRFRAEAKKLQDTAMQIDQQNQMREDSILTADQKVKVAALKEAVKAENKANPAARKTFVYDKKTMDDLGLTAEQQAQLTKLKGITQVAKWQHSQKMSKMTMNAVAEQDAVLTDAQKQKAAEMKTAIAEYNKTVQP